MNNQCTEERFLSDVKEHEMKIIRDNGVDRHIKFKRSDMLHYHFDLITWKGYLCVTGDCGTYVFSRIEDMFNFFIMSEGDFNNDSNKKLNINLGYWAEKCQAADRYDGLKKFSVDLFEEEVKERFDEYFEDHPDNKYKDDCQEKVERELLGFSDSEEYPAMTAAIDFKHKESNFQLYDFWEVDCKEYTFRYVWNLYAIVWGILKYRDEKRGLI